MIDLIKKTLLAGVGAAVITKEKLEDTLDDFVRQGKVQAADARIIADKIAEQGRKEFDDASRAIGAKLHEMFDRRDQQTEARLAELEARVRSLEEKLATPPSRAGEP